VKKLLVCAAATMIVLAVVLGAGVVGLLPSTADEALTVEFESLFEFAAIRQFAGAPEHVLSNLAVDAAPLATEARRLLSESPLDANDVQRGVLDMLLEIAGVPANEGDMFVLETVYAPIASGADYGKFVALRDGIVESEGVNRVVTAHAAAALDGLLRFLSDLPCPEKEEPPGFNGGDAQRSQLDRWADELDTAGDL